MSFMYKNNRSTKIVELFKCKTEEHAYYMFLKLKNIANTLYG